MNDGNETARADFCAARRTSIYVYLLRRIFSVIALCATLIFSSVFGVGDGRVKFIAVSNSGVAPIKIHTSRGSFLMDGEQTPNAALVFSQDHWQPFVGNVTWFPETQKQKLIGTGASGSSLQGTSVALSADGNTLAYGGTGDSFGKGAVWVWTRTTGASYTQQGNKLSSASASAREGASIALSGDGNTLAAGAPLDSFYGTSVGTVYIYTRTGVTWTLQQRLPDPTSRIGGANVGTSVALSRDGDTLVVGAYKDDNTKGAVWVFTRANGAWAQQGDKLVGSGAIDAPGAQQGYSVALSADGNTLAEGGVADNDFVGAMWIFVRINGAWVQQGSKLVSNDYTKSLGGAYQGITSSLSADGNTLAVGGRYDGTGTVYVGATWTFTRINGVWSQQGSKLVGAGTVGSASQGWSVVLSADGNTLVEGGAMDNSNAGAVWVWIRRNGFWVQMGNKLVGTGSSGTSVYQGSSVALSADGNTLAEGGIGDNSNVGAVWVFF